MKLFKYRLKDDSELWICDACRKKHQNLILLKSWGLIDKKEDDSDCEYCSHLAVTHEQTQPVQLEADI